MKMQADNTTVAAAEAFAAADAPSQRSNKAYQELLAFAK